MSKMLSIDNAIIDKKLHYHLSLYDTLVLSFTDKNFDNLYENIDSILRKVKNINPNMKSSKIHIVYNAGNYDDLLDNDKCKKLEQISNYLNKTYDSELNISRNNEEEYYSFEDTILANRKLDGVAKSIKNTRIDGKELSPFEKYMLAYEFVTDFVYKDSENDDPRISRNWIGVLNSDKIVCVGYSELLKELCNRIFDKDEVIVTTQSMNLLNEENKVFAGHQNNLIYIKDEKYNIDGIFYADPCWDSYNKNNRIDKPQAYCCIPLSDVKYATTFIPRFYGTDSLTKIYFDQFIGDEKYNDPRYLNVEETAENLFNNDSFSFFTSMQNRKLFSKLFNNMEHYELNTFLSDDEAQKMDSQRKELHKQLKKYIRNKYSSYLHINLPMFLPDQLEEKVHLNNKLDDIANSKNKDEVLNGLDILLNTINENKDVINLAYEKAKEVGIGVYSIDEFIANHVAEKRIQVIQEHIVEEKALAKRNGRKRNANKFIKRINELANSSPISIDAFINSYTIIGLKKGLKGRELRKYVDNRIEASKERVEKVFISKNCKNCFATNKKNESR